MKVAVVILLIISFLEGGALMAMEFIGAKFIAPYYGTSIYVWATIFTVSLGGLALGYRLGGLWSIKRGRLKILKMVLAIAMILTLLFPFIGIFILELTMAFPLEAGIVIAGICLLLPVFVCFGAVSPLVIQLLRYRGIRSGSGTGQVYAVSTFGGVLCTFGFGFYIIPFLGLTMALIIAGSLLTIALAVSFQVKEAHE